ncbi:MAG TPA: rhodanese-like domain-containing protein [Solirubrobacteraceae bacterium]|jgi:rhodanese-related sulfurtransferase|nr:rhodanese-like domain-containing protein [Solirubrobacteraceae bacterium]
MPRRNGPLAEQQDLSPEQVKALLDEGAIQLVDVREDHEWEAGRIGGARHIEMAHLSGEAASIDRETPVVFSCRVGSRSAMAAQAFRASGYDAYNLGGGLVAWAASGLPLEPAGAGYVAEH